MLEFLIEDNMISKEDRVAVGVSGGADSMVLLWALLDKQKQLGFHLYVINVNHHIRGEESDRDSLFVEEFCKKKKIEHIICDVDAKKLKADEKVTLEESARKLRYEVFASEMKKHNLNKLFLAHHKNDQAETILMHIFRGSGISGAAGIRQTEKIVRPLIDYTKAEILKIASEYGVKFVTDSTNAQNDASRNYLRNIVIPEIERVYPNAVGAVCEFGERCREIDEFIKSFVKPSLIVETPDYLLAKDAIFEEKPFIVCEYVKLIFEKLGVFSDIEARHYKLVLDLVKTEVNKKLDFPHNLEVKRTYDGLKFYKKSKSKKVETAYNFVIGEIDFDGYGKIKTSTISPDDVVYGEGALYVDQSKIRTDAVWRTRKDGDVFAKFGTGSKKLNDYFTDKKVDIDMRDKLPLLCSGSSVLVVAGLDISENVKIDASTDQIVKLDFEV